MPRHVDKIIVKDLYKILNISREATKEEIKASYRKLALACHPDRHGGDVLKTHAFKEASEAYAILTNTQLRQEYDISLGHVPAGWYNKNRRRPPPSDYRKVYAPHPPPNGKWHDAQRHYDMHYGDGMFKEAVKRANQRAKESGEFEYHSPLGKGFTFEREKKKPPPTEKAPSRFQRATAAGYHNNPFSKADQGPPTILYQYEEDTISDAKNLLRKRENIRSSLHKRRQERHDANSRVAATPGQSGKKTLEPFNQQNNSGCTIM
eukprot:Nitzschia sp. Nitz4//scaffold234_size30613//1118//2014//NITZ4_007957-RA/size30613-augustus-gene-0.24-mRNA-1//1//CDS//3329543398//2103//frame0